MSSDREGFWMALPGAGLLIVFLLVPFLAAVVLSFSNARLGSPLPTRFVGLRSYSRVAADPGFRRAVRNNAVFAAVVVPVQTALALGLALLSDGRPRLQAAFFLPVIFPMALIAIVWERLFALAGPDNWLRDPQLALPALMILSVWQGVGLQMVILLAALQSVSPELYEAAHLEGAGAWQRFRHVTLPGIREPLIFTSLMTMILCFRLFDQVQILTQGGPSGATTTVLFLIATSVFERLQVGLASAMTVLSVILVTGLTWLFRKFS